MSRAFICHRTNVKNDLRTLCARIICILTMRNSTFLFERNRYRLDVVNSVRRRRLLVDTPSLESGGCTEKKKSSTAQNSECFVQRCLLYFARNAQCIRHPCILCYAQFCLGHNVLQQEKRIKVTLNLEYIPK